MKKEKERETKGERGRETIERERERAIQTKPGWNFLDVRGSHFVPI